MEKDPQEELLSVMSELWKEAKKDSYCDEDGVRYSSDGKILLLCPVDFSGRYVIKDGVTEICSQAFRKCSKLTSIIIPNSVKKIGSFSFELCTFLDSIKIPNSVTTIDIGAFNGCGLKSVIIPGGVKSIESAAFENCRDLSDVDIREGVTAIGDYAFKGCTRLKKIKLPSSITTIGVDALANCPNLTYIIVPDGTKSKFVQMGLKTIEDKIFDRKRSNFTPDYFPELDLVPISSLPPEICSVFGIQKKQSLDDWLNLLFSIAAVFMGVALMMAFSILLPHSGGDDDIATWIGIIFAFGILSLIIGVVPLGRILMIKHGLRVGQRKFRTLKKEADFIERRITERDRWGELDYGLYIIAKNKKLGMLSFPSGDIVIEPRYDSVSKSYMSYGYYRLEKDKKCGLLKDDKLVIPVEYDKIEWLSQYILVGKKGKVGLCSSVGTEIIPIEYDAILYDENRKIIEANKGSEFFHFDEYGKPLV